ncbi:MAG: hypothetical protein J3Q66DRAFT_21357 [Benniella sp.]|nr:MAG: hypothetical protein J3Q66DRAFT_21357 [Benniella sp.]
MAANDPSSPHNSTSPSIEAPIILSIATSSLSRPAQESSAEGRETQPERSSNENELVPTTDFVSRDNAYDAIARHEPCYQINTTEENYEKLDQDQGQNQNWVHSAAQEESEYGCNINQYDDAQHEPTLPRRPRTVSSPPRPRAYSIHTYRVRANSHCGVIEEERESGEEERICEFHVDHGPSAIEEEEAALEFAAVLAAAKAASAAAKAASMGGGVGVAAAIGTGFGRDWAALASTEEESICMEDEEEEEEEDHCLSGLCMPQSHLFMTSVICSNTNARDGFANERTFLSWLSACNAMCLVSFSFITRALTLDALKRNDRPEHPPPQTKDDISRYIGYICFVAACLATIYSLLKYLRNIRRISTRYPFVQAGKWTFTVGMFFGTIIMVVLVLAYTKHL